MTAADDASSSSPPPPPATSLAPGFRFHPTDEELVSYYLKRKVLARPLRVDAISEVDLYKAVPWDLPQMSRIQSRDMEWYFFSPLDRKYSNRSRTNRATGKGYWKTTGKDRPVSRGGRVVGMKKTLVYHIGRAPKGERTNWVMHEYRLEDEELVKAGVTQDEYVVCRIFQKSGAGPQNGAQYGAPFLEEEWESDDKNMLLPDLRCLEQQISAPGRWQQFIQVDDDSEQERKVLQPLDGNEQQAVADDQLNTLDFVSVNNGQDITVPPVSNKVEENQESFTAMDQNILCGMNDDQRFGIHQYHGLQEPRHTQGYSEDDYLELKDVIDSPRVDYQGNQVPGIRNDQVSNTFSQITNLPKLHGVEEYFDSANQNEDLQEPMGSFPPFDDGTTFGRNEMLDPVMGNYPSGEQADDGNVYYDLSNHNLADDHGGYIEMNDFLYQVMPGSPNSDLVDELIAYFDATDYQTQNSHLGSPTRAESSLSQHQSKAKASGAGVEKRASSMQLGGEKNATGNDGYPVAGGMQSRKDWDKTAGGRLVGLLGSFAAPPALAAEHPMKRAGAPLDVSTSVLPSGSLQFTAGVIRVDGMAVADDREHSSIPKSPEVVHHLSLDLARGEFDGNAWKMHGGVISLVIRSGICFPVLSVLFLAISFKMAICICGSWARRCWVVLMPVISAMRAFWCHAAPLRKHYASRWRSE